mmetsp:Transcript_82496/g.218935  ORF Transcript_82496/g.218935 Transcript_82496/m.218935 type:complete len:223 (+) Transcript_82496:3-671(+)
MVWGGTVHGMGTAPAQGARARVSSATEPRALPSHHCVSCSRRVRSSSWLLRSSAKSLSQSCCAEASPAPAWRRIARTRSSTLSAAKPSNMITPISSASSSTPYFLAMWKSGAGLSKPDGKVDVYMYWSMASTTSGAASSISSFASAASFMPPCHILSKTGLAAARTALCTGMRWPLQMTTASENFRSRQSRAFSSQPEAFRFLLTEMWTVPPTLLPKKMNGR